MRVKLEDVCERGTSSLMQKDIVDKNGKYPVYGASGRIGSMETYQQEHQTVAVVKDGAGIGRTMLLPEKSSVIGTMQYLIPKNCIEPEYLYYVVKYMHLEKYFSGATIPHIYFRDYKTEEFNLHDKTEQQEIVSTLKRIEAIISNRQEQLSKLDELIKARFVEMFGNEHYDKKVYMQEVCKIITDGTHLPPKFTVSGIPFLFVSNIIANEIHYDTKKFISEETYNELIKRTPIEIGDILLSTVGSYGHPAIVKTTRPFCFQRHIAYLKPDLSVVNSEYLRCAILSMDVQRQIDEKVKGIAQKTLNLSEIRKIKISLSPLSLQNQFADFVAEVDKSKLLAELFAQNTCILAENRSK